ncbi:MAG: hypothetical protein QG618_1440 [Thermodesulfobacteriota bacterium]|nr:hypothetical protein [Thermodesulfobacteriota bacterium]
MIKYNDQFFREFVQIFSNSEVGQINKNLIIVSNEYKKTIFKQTINTEEVDNDKIHLLGRFLHR